MDYVVFFYAAEVAAYLVMHWMSNWVQHILYQLIKIWERRHF